MDTLSPKERSKRMSLIRSKDTKPELRVRRLIHSLGYRYRLHRRDLPGTPDLVFPARRKVIFVHGCFWHRHSDPDCKLARIPKSKKSFWLKKLEKNRVRDEKNIKNLKILGWDVLILWECELKDENHLIHKVKEFLDEVH